MQGTLTRGGQAEPATPEGITAAIAGTDFFWLDLDIKDPGPDEDIKAMFIDQFHFHPVAVESAEKFGQRPRIDDYDEFVHVVTFGMAGDGTHVAEVHCFITENSIISVHHGDCPALGSVRDRIAGHHSTDVAPPQVAVFYLIMDTLIDSFFPVLSDFDEAIDQLETAILRTPTEEQLGTLFDMKRQIITIRKVIAPRARHDRQPQRRPGRDPGHDGQGHGVLPQPL